MKDLWRSFGRSQKNGKISTHLIYVLADSEEEARIETLARMAESGRIALDGLPIEVKRENRSEYGEKLELYFITGAESSYSGIVTRAIPAYSKTDAGLYIKALYGSDNGWLITGPVRSVEGVSIHLSEDGKE